mmetsp:Transcript_68110/g.108060  ORF Transcript_68110/g.108060 Transcript_68110/m.108060 type:complete len:418 (+) Transcript_68110:72-1325(+)
MVLKKKKKKLGENVGGVVVDSSVVGGTRRDLGELVKSFSESLDFGPTEVCGTQEEISTTRAMLAPQVPELRTCLRQLQERLRSLRTAADTAAKNIAGNKAKSDHVPTGTAAYVDMKNQVLLSYIISLSYYLLLKVRGAAVRDHQVVLRLMWFRTLLEKLRPVDQRLQYQINKLLQMADAKVTDGAASDPKSLRPGQLATTVEDEEDDGDDVDAADPQGTEEDDGIYRPPRIAQVEYTGDHISAKDRAEKDFERQKRRLQQSDLVRSMREEFTDAPVEIRGEERPAAMERAQRKLREHEAYEEDNMIRLQVTKAEKRERKRLFLSKRSTSGGTVSLSDAADVNDIASMLSSGGKGKGKGKSKGRRGQGNLFDSFEGASKRLREARDLVDSVAGGRMPDSMGTFKKGRGDGGDGKRRKR